MESNAPCYALRARRAPRAHRARRARCARCAFAGAEAIERETALTRVRGAGFAGRQNEAIHRKPMLALLSLVAGPVNLLRGEGSLDEAALRRACQLLVREMAVIACAAFETPTLCVEELAGHTHAQLVQAGPDAAKALETWGLAEACVTSLALEARWVGGGRGVDTCAFGLLKKALEADGGQSNHL